MDHVYLDNAATTPVHPRVFRAMKPFFTETFGNPSSPHAFGEYAATAVYKSRETLARALGAKPWELIFTSGGSEANNLALRGICTTGLNKKKVIISAIEHSSVWEPLESLRNEGYEVVVAPVDSEGLVDIVAFEKMLDAQTILVSIMHVNNEIGTIQNIARIGALCQKNGVIFHTDAVQSFGKLSFDVNTSRIDLLTASAHKIGGPKGIGFLYIREGIPLRPLILGGGQERGLRGGTENVSGIVGFAAAYEVSQDMPFAKIQKSSDALLHDLAGLGGLLNGSHEQRVHAIINIVFPGIDAELLVAKLSRRGIYCSTRSACLSKQQKEHRVLKAIGLSETLRESSVRLTLHMPLTLAEHAYVVRAFRKALA